MDRFVLHSDYTPSGDQPAAIEALVAGIRQKHLHYQTLQGVTGSGKTFTMANLIERLQMPTLVISHNKTLAAQLYSELKAFFPENAVEYFVSYYDYYQPEAYIPATDTYIAKDSAINDELERLRLAATGSLIERKDVIVVASVSCIYGMGDPEEFASMEQNIVIDQNISRDDLLRKLVSLQYTRNDLAPERGQFRAVGDTVEVYLSHREDYLEIQFWGDSIDSMIRRNPMTRTEIERVTEAAIFPCKLFVTSEEKLTLARHSIREELKQQVRFFEDANRLVEAQRIHERTTYDLEMLQEVGYCQGIENYSRHLTGREPGSRPFTLIDYFPKSGFLTIIDESHATLPQLHAMQNADRNRKNVLVDNGFRLPSALDNRPLAYEEFKELQKNVVFVSATPGAYELSLTEPVKQVIRPTGLLDPKVEIRPLEGQVDDAIDEIRRMAEKKERVLVTTLTKKMAEELSEYLRKVGLNTRYLHSDLDALERVDLIRSLRAGEFDCLVGINLLREGLDLPEVSL
ncbi:MAG: excinuclease ABC subunit UvrB, partial [Lentisphaeria bacterium]|nr:excinuclease ABC subunit UvrB [Lentisphaeria bacterium]